MASTKSKMQKLSFQWNIKDFDDCDLVSDEFFDSPKFSIPDSTFKSDWILRMYPAGTKQLKVRDNLTLLLLRLDSGALYHTNHSISLLKRNVSRFHTEKCSVLCQPSGYTDSTESQMSATNIIEIKADVRKYLDGGVLSVLCEMEIHAHEAEKHIQLHATSSLIRNIHKPSNLDLILDKRTSFYQPYGKRFMCFEGTFCQESPNVYVLEIIDKSHPETTEVPVTINYCESITTWNIKRSSTRTLSLGNTNEVSVELSTRCMVESPLVASAIDVTPLMRKVQAEYRNMFKKSDFGDISIVVGAETLRTHIDILSSRCPVFAAMFSQEWREQAAKTVTIREFDFKTIRAMIEYIYFGGADEESDENAADQVELLKAAHMYQLDDLKSNCELLLCNRLDMDKVCSFMVLSETYDLPSLKRATLLFMNSNKMKL